MNNPNWENGLKQFIGSILDKINVPSSVKSKMLNPENMKTWIACFTHESYDPNVGANYEELELVGDHVMEYSFILYLYKNYEGINKAQMSSLKSQYISKAFQAQVALEMDLDKWVRIRVQKNTHAFEDLLEALFGCINIVGDNVKFGVGYGLCYNLINHIFSEVDIDFDYVKGKPKTQIKEMFEQLNWGEAVENTQNVQGKVRAAISFTQAALEDLVDEGFNFRKEFLANPTIALETGNSKKVAMQNAYKAALENLRKLGITEEWVNQHREKRMMKDPALSHYYRVAKEKTVREGYVDFYVKTIQTTKEGKYVQMIGVRPEGKLLILGTSQTPGDETEKKKELLIKYVA